MPDPREEATTAALDAFYGLRPSALPHSPRARQCMARAIAAADAVKTKRPTDGVKR